MARDVLAVASAATSVPSLRNLVLGWISQNCHLLHHGLGGLPAEMLQECVDLMQNRRESWSDEHFAVVAELTLDKSVQEINLRWCSALTSASLRLIAATCPALHTLDLGFTDATDETLQLICGAMSQLKDLSLVDCNKLHDAAIKKLSFLDNLMTLDLELCSGCTDAAIMHLAKRLPALSSLNLGGCRQVTNASISTIAEKLGKQLRRFSIAGNPNITDFDIEDLAANCCCLEALNLRACVRLTDAAMGKIGRMAAQQVQRGGSAQLRELDIGGCSRTTDKGLRALQKAAHLQSLDMRGINKVSVGGIQHLVSSTELNQLNITTCLPDDSAQELVSQVKLQCDVMH